MATFTPNILGNNAEQELVKLSLTGGPHDLIYNKSGVLTINNTDGGTVTVNISGNGVTDASCTGYGDLPGISSGKDIDVSTLTTVRVQLKEYEKYLGSEGNTVTVTITGATNSEGWLIEG